MSDHAAMWRPHALMWAERGQDTRRWAWFNIGCQMCAIDTGVMHGPITRGQHYLGDIYFPDGPQPLPPYPCEICGERILPGEKYTHDPKGETTHNDCARDWFRRNFGRESL